MTNRDEKMGTGNEFPPGRASCYPGIARAEIRSQSPFFQHRLPLFTLLATALLLPAAERKPLPGQAGNDDIELVGAVFIDRQEIQQALGADLGEGYVVVRIKATPKADRPLRIGPDDFTIISRKDGQRTQSLAPNQIAGNGPALVLKSAGSQGALGTEKRTSIGFGGLGGGSGIGNAPGARGGLDGKVEAGDAKAKQNPLLAVLEGKALPDKETTAPVEGLLYFPLDGKVKPKDLGLIYKGPAGKLVMEFANAKGGH